MKKQDLIELEVWIKNKIKEVPDENKPFWGKRLKEVKKKLYGV